MFLEIVQSLIKTITDLFVLVLLLRFYLQVARAPFKHPLCQFVMAATNFAVLPLRKLVPSLRGYDSATMLLAWLVSMVSNVILLALNPLYTLAAPETWVALTLLALLNVFKQSLILLMGAVIVQAVMSWVNPYNLLSPILDALTRPFLKPFRRATVGGVDLSPMILFLIIQFVLMPLVQYLEISFLTQLKVLMQ
ncbi:YggT family protein [Aquitalea sp. LB_tupeE]|uniref:YggT family protein n=1 Tax=Aquitalea sp. LB_tupeE TaxID=2748078 RepID=UPI0015B79135|nr:YggT family protein [Aquitalea sp. LB_tupeE]NWK77720.1 YggT family protein [Aquitalea sp. LB_tupeE]